MRWFALLLCTLPLAAQDLPKDLSKWKAWNLSAISLVAASSFDVYTTIGKVEANPMFPSVALGQDRRFNGKSAAIYGAVIVGNLLVQKVVVKRLEREGRLRAARKWKRAFTVVNFAAGGLHIAVAVRNLRMEGR